MSSGLRTEPPTPRRLREARRKGQVAVSRDLASAASFAAAAATLWATAGRTDALMRGAIGGALARAAATEELATADALAVLAGALSTTLSSSAAVGVAAVAAALLASAAQTGGLLAARALAPKAERLDPVAGMRRMASLRTLVELLKSWARLVAVAVAAASAIAGYAGEMAGAARAGGAAPFLLALLVVRDAALRAAILLALLGALDVALQRRLHLRDLRMTRDEVRRDQREEEGDPHLKSARRQAHRELAVRRMLVAARGASVVVANPTHVAAALRYDEGSDDAPRVVAKGTGRVARRIRRAAEQSGVRVIHDRPLARALARVEVGEAIPEALYEAVAEILAFVAERSASCD